MKKPLIILIIGFLLTSCGDKRNKNNSDTKINARHKNFLGYINTTNELEISHTDDKYGEWGGDSDIIKVYSDDNNIFANYSRYLGSTKPPMPPKENEKQKKWYEYKKLDFKIDSIKLNPREKKLIETAILELLQNKIRNKIRITHSGIQNSIISKDSSLIINDYPSIKWKSFQKLKKKLSGK